MIIEIVIILQTQASSPDVGVRSSWIQMLEQGVCWVSYPLVQMFGAGPGARTHGDGLLLDPGQAGDVTHRLLQLGAVSPRRHTPPQAPDPAERRAAPAGPGSPPGGGAVPPSHSRRGGPRKDRHWGSGQRSCCCINFDWLKSLLSFGGEPAPHKPWICSV